MTPNNQFIEEKCCRICSSSNLRTILDLGRQPLANSLISKDELSKPTVFYPLNLSMCDDCSLIQIRETIPPRQLFSNYLYFSSYSDALVTTAQKVSARLIQDYRLGRTDLVVELGSNDGYLLQFYQRKGISVLGVEPAENVAKVAQQERRIPTLVDFFDLKVAERIRRYHGPATIIHANNVLAHIKGIHDVISGMCALLALSGIIAAEVSYVKDMVEKGCFDMIYHEHLFYHSLDSLERLFRMHQLKVFDVEHIPNHGGSIRIYAGHPRFHKETDALCTFRSEEKTSGVNNLSFYEEFAHRIEQEKKRLCSKLQQIKRKGAKIAAYGAPAKATVLSNYLGLDAETLEYIVDRSPHKQGLYIPGPNIPIYHPDMVRKTKPDYLLILSWNLKDEIMKQMGYIRKWGGKFLIPLPKMKVVP